MDNNFDKDELLLRAVLPNGMYWKNGKLSSAAFKTKKGLSVSRVYDRPLEDAVHTMTQEFKGSIVSFRVEECTKVKAYVQYAPSKKNIYHCNVLQSPSEVVLSDF